MLAFTEQFLTHDRPRPGLRLIRFIRPDLRPLLDSGVGEESVLYRTIVDQLNDLVSGERLVFNFGLVERFPSEFFQLMMRLRQFVLSRGGQLILCCFRPEILPAVELMGGSRLFQLANSEETAIHEAWKSNHGSSIPRSSPRREASQQ